MCDYHGPESGHLCKVPHIPNGYEVHIDGKRYLSDVPSMQVSHIKAQVGCNPMYQNLQWHPDTNAEEWVDDRVALDFTASPSPHIYFIPPATY